MLKVSWRSIPEVEASRENLLGCNTVWGRLTIDSSELLTWNYQLEYANFLTELMKIELRFPTETIHEVLDIVRLHDLRGRADEE